MKPYYEHGGITIYHGDCREMLPGMVADAIVTDPPYRSLDIDVIRGTTTRLVGGHNSRKGSTRVNGTATEWFNTMSDEDTAAALLLASSCLSATGAMYVFSDVKTGLLLFPSLHPANVLVWDKGTIGMGYNWRRMHEWIAYCPGPEHRLRDAGLGDIIRAQGVDEKRHPTEKPVGLIEVLLVNSTDAGQLVLDPFAGSGSALMAAKNLSRRAIGIEIEERYCEVAAKRLAQEVLAL